MNRPVLFHEQLLRERKRRGWSQEKVAQLLGIDPKTVGRWERNENFPTIQLHGELCHIFGKSAEEMGLVPDESSVSRASGLPPSPEQQPEGSSDPHHSSPLMRSVQHHFAVTSPSQTVLIEERIQGILRNNAKVDHTQLFGADTFLQSLTGESTLPGRATRQRA